MARILVVDDDPVIVRLVEMTLRVVGHQVVTTEDYQKVVEVAAAEGVQAVVLDILLHRHSGFDVLHALRADPRTSPLPVIMLSALQSGADRVRALREGADDYLAKPFEAMELVLRLKHLLEPRRG